MKSAELLQKEVTFLKEQLRNKNNTIKQLEEMIKSFQQKRFGTSSEKKQSRPAQPV